MLIAHPEIIVFLLLCSKFTFSSQDNFSSDSIIYDTDHTAKEGARYLEYPTGKFNLSGESSANSSKLKLGTSTASSTFNILTSTTVASTTLLTSTLSPSHNLTTTTTNSITTSSAKPEPNPPSCHRFDVPSFIGGIVFTLGLLAISFIGFKFYKARNERNYHTL